jgi:hypothetical protein
VSGRGRAVVCEALVSGAEAVTANDSPMVWTGTAPLAIWSTCPAPDADKLAKRMGLPVARSYQGSLGQRFGLGSYGAAGRATRRRPHGTIGEPPRPRPRRPPPPTAPAAHHRRAGAVMPRVRGLWRPGRTWSCSTSSCGSVQRRCAAGISCPLNVRPKCHEQAVALERARRPVASRHRLGLAALPGSARPHLAHRREVERLYRVADLRLSPNRIFLQSRLNGTFQCRVRPPAATAVIVGTSAR